MTTTQEEQPEANWNEADIVAQAILMLVIEEPIFALAVDSLRYKGGCDDCSTIILSCNDPEIAELLGPGTQPNLRLAQLIEKPVDVVFEG